MIQDIQNMWNHNPLTAILFVMMIVTMTTILAIQTILFFSDKTNK